LLGDFRELAGFNVVDEAAHGDVAYVGMIFDAGDLAADILLDVFEGVEVRRRDGGDPGLVLEFVEELLVGEGDHAAIGVIDDDEFLRAQQVMGNDQRAQGVFGGDAPGIANDVRVAGLEAEKLLNGEAGVHAGEDGEFFGGGHGEAALVEFGGVLLIGCQNLVGDAHVADPLLLFFWRSPKLGLLGPRLFGRFDYNGQRESMQDEPVVATTLNCGQAMSLPALSVGGRRRNRCKG
jgi:hypothetical protein